MRLHGSPHVDRTDILEKEIDTVGNDLVRSNYFASTNPHCYSFRWVIIILLFLSCRFLVDDKLYRQIKNNQMYGAPYPYYYPMRVYATIWNADNWATQGGQVKTDWSQAPFTAYFRNYRAIPCPQYENNPLCLPGSGWFNQQLDESRKQQMTQVDSNNKIYDYCKDPKRYKNGPPPRECELN